MKKSNYSTSILWGILIFLVAAGLVNAFLLTNHVYHLAKDVKAHREDYMSPLLPDPGKTAATNKNENGVKVSTGIYLDRIEELDIKQSRWTYEFYLWFKWKPNEIDLLGEKHEKFQNELPFNIVNGEIISADLIEKQIDREKNTGYIQYQVKAKTTQFFDVRLFPIDEHYLIVPIEHKWLDRGDVIFIPDTLESKLSSRVMIPGYTITKSIKLIEKAHAYQSARGNPKFSSTDMENFSQFRAGIKITKNGLPDILKLFLINFIAVIVTFIAPFSPDPSRYTVGAIFTTAGANYILASKLPASHVYTFAEIINTYCSIVIIIMMALLAIVPAVIMKDGKSEKIEKRLNNAIMISMFLIFIITTALLNWAVLN
jgi:hypothetical protein